MLPPEEIAKRPKTRLNLARMTATARANLTANEQVNLLNLVHQAALAVKATKPPSPTSPIYEQLGEHVEGPTFLADEYGLPKEMPGQKQPEWVYKRRKFLASLSSADRNTILTGDPGFAFDPVAYEVCLAPGPAPLPQILQNNFAYLIPAVQQPVPAPPAGPAQQAPPQQVFQRRGSLHNIKKFFQRQRGAEPSESESSSPSPASSGYTTPCPSPPTARKPGRPPADGARKLAMGMELMQVSPPSGQYSLRSSVSAPPPAAGPSPPARSGWHRALQTIKNESRMLLDAASGMPTAEDMANQRYEEELLMVQRAHARQLHAQQVHLQQQRQRQAEAKQKPP